MFSVYGIAQCPSCVKAKQTLEQKGYEFDYINLDKQPEKFEDLSKQGFKTVPQVYHNGKHIGGYEALADYLLKIS